ncbi:MAG TPA: hypothetical protein VKE74_32320, partial [Gemmataceae bacterium]|nr:hypothetical protein [Gemmataceae bacterium]
WEGVRSKGLSYQQTAEALRDHIKRATGLPMTVAFARTRTLAKLFGDIRVTAFPAAVVASPGRPLASRNG